MAHSTLDARPSLRRCGCATSRHFGTSYLGGLLFSSTPRSSPSSPDHTRYISLPTPRHRCADWATVRYFWRGKWWHESLLDLDSSAHEPHCGLVDALVSQLHLRGTGARVLRAQARGCQELQAPSASVRGRVLPLFHVVCTRDGLNDYVFSCILRVSWCVAGEKVTLASAVRFAALALDRRAIMKPISTICDHRGPIWANLPDMYHENHNRNTVCSLKNFSQEQGDMGIDNQSEETTIHCNTVVRHGDLIAALHHSTSPARRPVQTSMQTIVSYPDDDTTPTNHQHIDTSLKVRAILGWHPQDELA